MDPDDAVLANPYAPGDLTGALETAGIDKTILVQAAPTVDETEYLLGIADATEVVAKVVGWVDFENPAQIERLEALANHPKFAGVRPMIQDLPDDDWMLRDDVQWAYQALIDLDLTFDCLGFPRHLENFFILLKKYPKMNAVLDHCMKPQFREHSTANFAKWSDGISHLANETDVYCKLSGLVTEADDDWSVATLRPYVDHVLNEFGPSRTMWGSDWPVVRLRCEYGDWFDQANELTAHFPENDRRQIFAKTAATFYRV